jgi:hypothetical protein
VSSVIIVDPKLLPEAPLAFRQYVKEFFVKKKMLGREVLVAATTITNGNYGSKGVAPSHSLDLRRFSEGLPPGQDLNDWIRKAEGKFLWRFHGVDEHRDCGACDDD